MGGNREYNFYPFWIAVNEIKCLIDARGMCCYADLGDREVVQEFDGD